MVVGHPSHQGASHRERAGSYKEGKFKVYDYKARVYSGVPRYPLHSSYHQTHIFAAIEMRERSIKSRLVVSSDPCEQQQLTRIHYLTAAFHRSSPPSSITLLRMLPRLIEVKVGGETWVFGAMGDRCPVSCSGKAGESLSSSVNVFDLPRLVGLVAVGVEDSYIAG
jgi:hypothetical protein